MVAPNLIEALGLLRKLKEIRQIEFGEADVVRHPLVARIVRAYDPPGKAANSDKI